MDKPKRKNSSFLRGQARSFIPLWGGSYALAILASYLITQQAEQIVTEESLAFLSRISLLFLFLLMSLPAAIHTQIIERLFKQSMRGWMLYNTVAAGLTVLALLVVNPGTHWQVSNLIFNAPPYFVVSALAQTLWLWGRTRFAWLWLPISLVSSLGPLFIFRTSPNDITFNAILLVIYSLVQGILMYFLLTHPKGTEKAKNEFATDEGSDDERLQRLQDNDDEETPQDAIEDRAMKKKAW